jgi:hypothetical protein
MNPGVAGCHGPGPGHRMARHHGPGRKRKKPHGHYSVRLDARLLVSQFRRCGDKRRGAQRDCLGSIPPADRRRLAGGGDPRVVLEYRKSCSDHSGYKGHL